MNMIATLLSSAVIVPLGLATFRFLRLLVLARLARILALEGMKQGDMCTNFDPRSGKFEVKTTGSE